MLMKIAKKIFGSSNERNLREIRNIVQKINSHESKITKMSDEEIKEKIQQMSSSLKSDPDSEKKLDLILPEAFALIREAAFREFGQRAYDVQLMGGIALHQGNISEMRTGEGKSLTAIFPAFAHALRGESVHIITVNDYLAKRDADRVRPLFEKLGFTVGCNISGLTKEEKQSAYKSDIVYGTANEFGFDYLRDHMALSVEDRAQRDLTFAIIDEVDSVLIDEARTPLIISDANEESVELYKAVSDIPLSLKEGREINNALEHREEGDYYIDLKTNNVFLTEDGYKKVEKALIKKGILTEDESLYDIHNSMILSIVTATIKAHTLFFINKHYIVSEDKKVKIIDEHTGRIMEGRRWNDGLHQAIEAKENVEINPESITLATITLQNYFKLYKKLSGMTGTADTEAFEFQETYGLNTIVIPTNKPIKRIDYNDKLFLTFDGKINAVLEEVRAIHEKGQPILIGTNSIEKNELIYTLLCEKGFKPKILNAKNHHREAEIIAQAGKYKAITVATNMAGRGTDIILGGNIDAEIQQILNSDVFSEETKQQKIDYLKADWDIAHAHIVSLGGLHVIGTERNESRRIDNQLRGRAGRQGDPGSSIFFTSFDDDLLKPYAERIKAPFKMLNISENEALEGKMLSKQVANAQEKVEKLHYEMRKNLMDFDSTISKQREVVYSAREHILTQNLDNKDGVEYLKNYFDQIIDLTILRKLEFYIPKNAIFETSDINGLIEDIAQTYDILLPITPPKKIVVKDEKSEEDIIAQIAKPEELLTLNSGKQLLDNIIYENSFDPENIHNTILHFLKEILRIKLSSADDDLVIKFKKVGMLQIIDRVWREHLTELDYLKKGIHLRGYAQKDPKQEYKREAFQMFQELFFTIQNDFVEMLMNVEIQAYGDMTEQNKTINEQLNDLNK